MNLLVTGAWNAAKENMQKLKDLGHSVVFLQREADALPCGYDWVEGVVCSGLFLSHPIERFTRLRYIQLTSAGLDRVPMDYIRANGIEIHNAGGVYSVPMAEHAISGILQIYRKAAFFCKNQREHRWEKNRGLMELAGKTVCVVGCGSVGTECAKRCQAFGCRVIGIATGRRKQPFFDDVRAVEELAQVLPLADVVILAVPLTNETRGLMNADRFAEMKPESILINISRGAVVDETALETALGNHTLGGAVLDVFEEEPLDAESPLWDMENVIITPHNSFVGEGNDGRLGQRILHNLERTSR